MTPDDKDAAAFHVHWFILVLQRGRAPIKNYCPSSSASVPTHLVRRDRGNFWPESKSNRTVTQSKAFHVRRLRNWAT